MNKFVVYIVIFIVALSFSSLSQATLITNLTQVEIDSADYSNAEDHLTDDLLGVNYINYKGYDWAWVSPVNLETSGGNTLYAPELQKNWLFADNALLNILKNELTLADFTNDSGDIIHSVEFFNSNYEHVDVADFNSDFVNSEWTVEGSFMSGLFGGQETFYVREAPTAGISPTPIPEPLTILIFASAFILLHTKLRKKSV
ncbi:hypothetical protein [Colwellia psychrerythraea]|uniref:PEP motif anchor domain protein n=1 Tax=Colwellia psychrerythraea TaxID=28229 RepID=A0A099KU43_COLPS|nr:hypothetical protein [Colwellia psychrerythraea]KGJ94299.1 hypothetical protein ND2E_1488 [Colwellia psychrerythraea]